MVGEQVWSTKLGKWAGDIVSAAKHAYALLSKPRPRHPAQEINARPRLGQICLSVLRIIEYILEIAAIYVTPVRRRVCPTLP